MQETIACEGDGGDGGGGIYHQDHATLCINLSDINSHRRLVNASQERYVSTERHDYGEVGAMLWLKHIIFVQKHHIRIFSRQLAHGRTRQLPKCGLGVCSTCSGWNRRL